MNAGERPRQGQLLLVVACLAAVVVAATAVPGVAGPGTGSDESGADGDGGSGRVTTDDGDGSGGGGGVGIGDILRWLFGEGGGERRVPPDYDVTVAPDPVPGRTVVVTVQRDGRPVEDAAVSFGDRQIGRTDADGQVRGRVPYSDDELVVRVRPPDGAPSEAAAGPVAALDRGLSPQATLGSTPAVGPVDDGPVVRRAEPTATPENVTEQYQVPTDARVRVVGRTDPGATVRVVASVAGDPLPRATVRVNGQRVGQTNASGVDEVQVPDDGTRRLRVRVERGTVSGARTVAVRRLTVRVQPVDPLAVPTRPATVEARIGTEPAANATLSVGGERVGQTDAGGRAALTLPADPTVAVVAERGDRVARRSLLPAYATTVGVALVPALALFGLATAAVRRRRQVTTAAREAGRGLLALATWLGRLGAALARGAVRLAVGTGRAVARLARWLVGVPARLAAWASPRAALAALRSVPPWAAGLPRRAVGGLRADEGETRRASGDAAGGSAAGTAGLAALWVAFARVVLRDDPRRRTPADVARAAVERGLPADAVEQVTDAYREWAYAPVDPPASEAERAAETLRTLVAQTEGNGDDERGSEP